MSLRCALVLMMVAVPFRAALADEAPAEIVLKKSVWVAEMKKKLPEAFCAERMYFRQCFEVTQQRCLAQAKKDTDACLAKHDPKLPTQFRQPQDGTEWGTLIGTCAGVAYEKAFVKERKKDARCDDAANWVP